MQIQTLSTENLSEKDLFNLIKMDTIDPAAKRELLEQIVVLYHTKREFNLYKNIIEKLFIGTYHLGKTKIHIDKKISTALKVIDLIAKYEAQSNENIPEEHSKYLFAFIKEFLYVINKLVQKNELTFGHNVLIQQLEWLKQITSKSKNNADVVTTFETIIRDIQTANPLLLETSNIQENLPQVQKGELTLTTPLYKLSKKAFLGVLKDVHLYKEEEFFKIVIHAYSKYDSSIFREIEKDDFPFIATALLNPDKKMDGFNVHNSIRAFFYNVKEERLKNVNYYPLKCTNVEEFYDFYMDFIDKLDIDGNRKIYIRFSLLERIHSVSEKLGEEFVNTINSILEDITNSLNSKKAKTLTDIYEANFKYPEHIQLILTYGSNRGYYNRLSYDIVMKDGKFEEQLRGKIKKMPTKYFGEKAEEVVIDVFTGPELEVLTLTFTEVLDKLKPYISFDFRSKTFNVKQGSPISESLLKSLELFYNHYLNIEINKIEVDVKSGEFDHLLSTKGSKSEYFGLLFKNSKNSYFSHLLRYRFENKLLTKSELDFIFNDRTYYDWLDLRSTDSEAISYYCKKVVTEKIVDFAQDDVRSNIYSLPFNHDQEHEKLMFELFEIYEPNIVALIRTLVKREEEESTADFQKRFNKAVYTFFKQRLFDKGYRNYRFLF